MAFPIPTSTIFFALEILGLLSCFGFVCMLVLLHSEFLGKWDCLPAETLREKRPHILQVRVIEPETLSFSWPWRSLGSFAQSLFTAVSWPFPHVRVLAYISSHFIDFGSLLTFVSPTLGSLLGTASPDQDAEARAFVNKMSQIPASAPHPPPPQPDSDSSRAPKLFAPLLDFFFPSALPDPSAASCSSPEHPSAPLSAHSLGSTPGTLSPESSDPLADHALSSLFRRFGLSKPPPLPNLAAFTSSPSPPPLIIPPPPPPPPPPPSYASSRPRSPTYLHSREKGYLLLSDEALASLNVTIHTVSLFPADACLGGGSSASWLLQYFVGYDTVILNQLHTLFQGGYVHNVHSYDLYNLNFPRVTESWEELLYHKIRVFVTSVLLVFTTTTLVAFTLRETHTRVLRFTVHLRYRHRHRAQYLPILLTHCLESLAFVPIMIGVLMFLFEFFEDQVLAFLVFSLVWSCEIFSMLRVRANRSMRMFPCFFFSLFLLFMVYLYSFPLGFSYVAFACWSSSVLTVMLHFANRFPGQATYRAASMHVITTLLWA